MNDFGKYVAECRKKAGLSQAKLAQRASCSSGTIGQIETGVLLPSLERAEKLADALGIHWKEFAPYFYAAVKARDLQKHIPDLEKHYTQRFDGQKISDPLFKPIFESFQYPQDLIKIEARAERVAIFTHDFWSDFKSFGLDTTEQTEETSPYTTQFTQVLQNNLLRGVDYDFFYPGDEPGIHQRLRAVQQLHQDLGSYSTSFHAIFGPLQWGLFAGHERVFYFDPQETRKDLRYNLGFFIDKLGVQSPFGLLIHERLLDQHLERYNKAIPHLIEASPLWE